MFHKLFLALILTCSVGLVQAQKIKLVSGNLGFLKEVSELQITYSYNNMAVGKFKKESDYVKKKTEEYNKKEPGRGDQWATAWVADRENRFHPKFEQLFNEYTKGKINGQSESPEANYRMNVNATFIEPGFNVGVSRKPASLNTEITFFSMSEPSKELAKITVIGALGQTFGGYDFDTGLRIQEAYAKTGKEVGRFLMKYKK